MGTPLAAPILGAVPALAFALDSLTYAFSAVRTAGIDVVERRTLKPDRWRTSDIVAGFKSIWYEPVVRQLAVLSAGFNLGLGAVLGVFVLYVQDVLGGGAWTLSGMMMAAAVGSTTAGWLLGRVVSRIEAYTLLWVSRVLASTMFLVMALSQPVLIALLAYGGYGAAAMAISMVTRSERQARIPAAEYGKATTAHRFVSVGALMCGNLIGGMAARYLVAPTNLEIALRAPFVISAVVVAVSGIVLLPGLRRGLDSRGD